MPLRMYHGTSLAHAQAIIGPPPTLDVTRGRGEFGRGFYFGDSRGFAMTWASNRYREPALVEAAPEEDRLMALKHKKLDADQSDALRAAVGSDKKTYLCGIDLVIGTVKNNPRRLQYKFESEDAQAFLHESGRLEVIK